MKAPLHDLLPAEILADLAGDEAMSADELADLADAFAAVGLAEAPMTPSAGLRDRVLEGAAHPMLAYAERVARMVHISLHRARELIVKIADERVWRGGVLPGIAFCDIDAGPEFSNAIVGFLRVAPGAPFPPHSHLGDERVLVLQGGMVMGDMICLPGDVVPADKGSTHQFVALPDEELIYLAIAEEGVDFSAAGGPLVRVGGLSGLG